jgi:hypothetical protein
MYGALLESSSTTLLAFPSALNLEWEQITSLQKEVD